MKSDVDAMVKAIRDVQRASGDKWVKGEDIASLLERRSERSAAETVRSRMKDAAPAVAVRIG